MSELVVVALGTDEEQLTIVQMQVDGTGVARTRQKIASLPVATTDMSLRRIQDISPDVVIVDIPKNNSGSALHAIELLHSELPTITVFAVGETNQPQVIISAMRSGAREFLERPTSTSHLLEAFLRLATSRAKTTNTTGEQGKVIAVLDAKGGCGATTIAVNLASALHQLHGSTAIVDLAPLGHAAIHLNVRPMFTVSEVLRNAHRLDHTLLEGYMTRCDSGLHLLGGVDSPLPEDMQTADLARVFDVLVARYRYVVVDLSARFDIAMRFVCNLSRNVLLVSTADVASLWSAGKVRQYLGEGTRERVGLVLNRFRKIPGLNLDEIESSTHSRILFKVPNQYPVIADSINRGVPVVTDGRSEIARAFVTLAGAVISGQQPQKMSKGALSIF